MKMFAAEITAQDDKGSMIINMTFESFSIHSSVLAVLCFQEREKKLYQDKSHILHLL